MLAFSGVVCLTHFSFFIFIMLCLLCGLFFVSFDFCLSSFYGLAIVYLSFDLRILITPLVSLHSSYSHIYGDSTNDGMTYKTKLFNKNVDIKYNAHNALSIACVFHSLSNYQKYTDGISTLPLRKAQQ